MSEHFEYRLCGFCATPNHGGGDQCPACGARMMLSVTDGYILSFPSETMPCPGCGSTDHPLEFRGWVRVTGFVWFTRETRMSTYLCAGCREAELAKVLWWNALLGWWSIRAWFWHGWRAIYSNWRAVWAAPREPWNWGAMNATEFADDLRALHAEAVADADEDWLRTETPLAHLTEAQMGIVLAAEDLYELLAVDPAAGPDDLRRAYRQQARASHPDLHAGSTEAAEQMRALNNAWEILGNARMREAYDWLEDQRTEAAVA